MGFKCKTIGKEQISYCLRFKDKNGKSYTMNRKERRKKKGGDKVIL